MIEFDVNENAGGGNRQPLPEGTYDFQVVAVDQKSSSAGNPQLQVSCSVVGGPQDGKVATLWYALVPQSGWKLQNLLDATGINYDVDGNGDSKRLRFDEEDLIDCYFQAHAVQREWKGKKKNDFTDEASSALSKGGSSNGNGNGGDVKAAPSKAAPPTSNQPEKRERRRLST